MPNKKKILLIEDEETLVDIYSTKLNLEGFEVIVARDGILGVNLALKHLPDLILLDIILPQRDGFDVLTKLKQNPQTKKIPVIIISNLGQEYEIKKGLSLGAVKFLTKTNYTPAQVVEEIKKVLKF